MLGGLNYKMGKKTEMREEFLSCDAVCFQCFVSEIVHFF